MVRVCVCGEKNVEDVLIVFAAAATAAGPP